MVAARSGAEQNHLFDTVDLCDGLCNTTGVFVVVDDGGNDRKGIHAAIVAPRAEVSWCVRADRFRFIRIHTRSEALWGKATPVHPRNSGSSGCSRPDAFREYALLT